MSQKPRVKPPNIVRVRKLRHVNVALMSQKNPENSPVAPSYGLNDFWSVGSLADKTGFGRFWPKNVILVDSESLWVIWGFLMSFLNWKMYVWPFVDF